MLTVVEPSGGAQWPVLAQVADGDVWELALDILDEPAHDRVFVESNEDHLGQAGHPGQCGKRVPHHWLNWCQLTTLAEGQQEAASTEPEEN